MENHRGGSNRSRHKGDTAPAFGQRHTAEENPPHQDDQAAHHSAKHAEDRGIRGRDWQDKPEQPLQYDSGYSWPQPEMRFRLPFV